jgi:hypothetical protein
MDGRLQESLCREWWHFGFHVQVRVKEGSASHVAFADPHDAAKTAVILGHLAGTQGMVVGHQATTFRKLIQFPDKTQLWCESMDLECLHYR